MLTAILLDSTGRILAISPEWSQINSDAPQPGSSLTEIDTGVPGLAKWILESLAAGLPTAQREFPVDNETLSASLLSLNGLVGMPQLLLLLNKPSLPILPGEDVAARLRHDIKNRIGGLKLYATFLKRKLGEQPELLEVIGKIIDSLDQLTKEANNIRFGSSNS
ncbi:MAG: hypothetical protein AB1489_00025 [Acidobacteriota bacterium]